MSASREYGTERPGLKFAIVDGGPAAYDKPRRGSNKTGTKSKFSQYHDGEGDREPEDRSRQYEVCAYKYQFEDGAHAFDVVRLANPKGFRFRAPDGSPSIAGIRRVPYRLPELLAGVAAGATVYLCEGERDADAAAALGLVATTNPGGAAKSADGMATRWLPHFNKAFAGARVVIVPDRDEPGRIRARFIAASLRNVAARVTVAELPGDAKDL